MKKLLYVLCALACILSLTYCSKKPKGVSTAKLPTTRSLPSKPSAPSTPSVPSAPKTPSIPSTPSTPSTSSAPSTPKVPTTPKRPDPSTLNRARPKATTFEEQGDFSPLISYDEDEANAAAAQTGNYNDYEDDDNDQGGVFNEIMDIVPEKEAEVPVFNDSDIFFYQTISNDQTNDKEKFRIIDAQMNYNVDMEKLYTLKEILLLYDDGNTEAKKPTTPISIPTFEGLKKELAEKSKNDQNFIKVDVVNTFRTDYERQRRREALLESNDYYNIVITNEASSSSQTKKSLGMMTLDTFISSVNRVQLKNEEEAILMGASVYNAIPIDFAASFSPYTFGVLKDLEINQWVVPKYSLGFSARAHYKFKNEYSFMMSAGLKFGLTQSLNPFIYNMPIMGEFGIGFDKIDIYAGAGLIFSDPVNGFFGMGVSVDALYNFFFGKHSSAYVGANISLGIAMGELVNGKKIDLTKFFISPVAGYKYALDSVRNGKVISFDDRDWYEIVILDPVDDVKRERNEAIDRRGRFFVEIHYSGDPFDISVFGSPYTFSSFIHMEDTPPLSPKDISLYAFNFGVAGHYKVISDMDKAVGIGLRLDFTQSIGKLYSLVPILIDANLSLLKMGIDLHAGVGMSITHSVYGGIALAAKVGASYNLPLSLKSFIVLGLDVGARVKLDFKSDKKVSITHAQAEPFVGYKYSFDKYERLVFDAETGLSTDECYIIDIVNDSEVYEERILKEGKK